MVGGRNTSVASFTLLKGPHSFAELIKLTEVNGTGLSRLCFPLGPFSMHFLTDKGTTFGNDTVNSKALALPRDCVSA